MKRFALFLLIAPIACAASGAMRAFERFDPFYDYSETFYYGDFQSSFERPLAGFGLRYKDEEIGFDSSLSGSYPMDNKPAILQADAMILYFPFTDFLYIGSGAGISIDFGHKLSNKTYVKGSLGTEFRSDRFGKYFAEATLQAPTKFEQEGFRLFPGFRVGVGF